MDVAEDADHARLVEAHRLRSAGGVAPEVEGAHVGQREDVVEGRIAVREVDDAADADGDDVRHEALAALIEPGPPLDELAGHAARHVVEIDDAGLAIERRPAADPPPTCHPGG